MNISRFLAEVSAIMLVFAIGLATPRPLAAEFDLVEIVPLSDEAHGIAFDGSVWHIARPITSPGYWNNYDDGFTFMGSTTLLGTSDVRGLTFDSSAETLFVSDYNNDLIYEYTLDGSELQSFGVSAGGPEALAFDAIDNTLWIAYFSGTVERRSRTGTLIDSFIATGFQWSGLAIDPISDTLLLMEDNDILYEFRKDGALIQELIDIDQITDNGLGLYYDATEGKLYATDQFNAVAVFQDTSRIPIFVDGFESGDTSSWSSVNP